MGVPRRCLVDHGLRHCRGYSRRLTSRRTSVGCDMVKSHTYLPSPYQVSRGINNGARPSQAVMASGGPSPIDGPPELAPAKFPLSCRGLVFGLWREEAQTSRQEDIPSIPITVSKPKTAPARSYRPCTVVGLQPGAYDRRLLPLCASIVRAEVCEECIPGISP